LAQKLGEIEKPKVSEYEGKRKLFCLPLVPEPEENLVDELRNMIDLFWSQAASQLDDLEKLGKIDCIFFESVTQTGEQGLETVKSISPKCYNIIKKRIDEGATLVETENKETFDEFLDLSLCLSVCQRSQKVFNKILEYYRNVTEKRTKQIAKTINNTLKDDKPGLLVMTDEYRLQIQANLPNNIQFFLIRPPALNNITNWIRTQMTKQQ
jgi:hypothetical protein